MMAARIMTDDELQRLGVRVLIRELGIVNSTRFLNIARPPKKGADALKQHREWLASIDQEVLAAEILEQVRQEYEKEQRNELLVSQS